MYTKHPAASITLLDKKFEKIPHLRGFISLENFFRKKLKNFPIFDRLFLGEKNFYNNDIVSNVRKTCCPVG